MKFTNLEKLYVVLCALFVGILVTIALTYKKIVYLPIFDIHTFTLSVGVMICPILFVLSDLLAEFYEKGQASFCVKLAIGINIVIAFIIISMDSLEATSWSTVNAKIFHQVFGSYGLAFLACMFTCYVAQLVDINIYLWLKKLTKGKWLWIRNNGSTAVSLFVDTIIAAGLLTMIGIYPKEEMVHIILHAYSYKLFFSFCGIPFFYLFIWLIRTFILDQNTLSIIDQPKRKASVATD